MSTEKEALYICSFAHNGNAMAMEIRASINTAICLLGQRSLVSICETARELGLVLRYGAKHLCKHCAKSKAEWKTI